MNMSKKITLVFISSFLAGLAPAQDSARLKLSATYQQGYDFYSRRALTQPLRPVEQYAVVSARYAHEEGDFARRQEAAAQRETQFLNRRNTEGERVPGQRFVLVQPDAPGQHGLHAAE